MGKFTILLNKNSVDLIEIMTASKIKDEWKKSKMAV